MADLPVIEYVVGAELPDQSLVWKDYLGQVINYSTGWTFTLRLATATTTTKSSGITGAATAPNITVTWTAAEWDSVPVGQWQAQLWARRTADSKDRVMPLVVNVKAAIT